MAAAPKISIKELQKALTEASVPQRAAPSQLLLPIGVLSRALVPAVSTSMATTSTAAAMSTQAVRIEDDYHGWLLDQAAALRDRRHVSLDTEHLAEELEDMAALRREALRSDLTTVLVHMLKLACEIRPTERAWRERQWKLDVVEHRDRVNDLLSGSGTLRAEFEAFKADAYRRARKRAGLAIDPNQAAIGPEDCPWSTADILDDDFFPSPIAPH